MSRGQTLRGRLEEEEAQRDREYTFDGPICLHCSKEIDAACETVIEAEGETYCGTLCALLVVTHEHAEGCECLEAAEAFSLPTAASCHHCKAKLRNALTMQAGAWAAFGKGGAA